MIERYSLILIPLADKPGGPNGAQRVRALLKLARRRFGLRAEWMPSDTGTDTRSTAKTASRGEDGTCETSEADAASAGGKNP
jgi:hypothetical protein